jgi:hypothetical protein
LTLIVFSIICSNWVLIKANLKSACPNVHRIELQREPHVSELEEVVDRKIAALEAKNVARKVKRAAAQNDSEVDVENSMSESRWQTVQEFINKWEPKLKRWDDIMERIEFEEVIVEQPPTVRVDSMKKIGKHMLILQEAAEHEKEKGTHPQKVETAGGADGGSSSSSDGGESESIDDEEGEVDIIDSEEFNISNDNEPVGVFEKVYRSSCKEVPDKVGTQRDKAGGKPPSTVQKKDEAVGGTCHKAEMLPKQV